MLKAVCFSSHLPLHRTLSSNSTTFRLANIAKMGDLLDNRDRKFTLFVPNNRAWENIEKRWPNEYKKINMPDFAANVSTLVLF